MDIAKKSARAAYIFGRWMEIRQKHATNGGDGSGCFCSLEGGRTLYEYLARSAEKAKMLECLAATKERLMADLDAHEDMVNEVIAPLQEKVSTSYEVELRGFWIAVLEMIEGEGGDKNQFLEFCRNQHQIGMIHSVCNNETYGVEGWLYLNLVEWSK